MYVTQSRDKKREILYNNNNMSFYIICMYLFVFNTYSKKITNFSSFIFCKFFYILELRFRLIRFVYFHRNLYLSSMLFFRNWISQRNCCRLISWRLERYFSERKFKVANSLELSRTKLFYQRALCKIKDVYRKWFTFKQPPREEHP